MQFMIIMQGAPGSGKTTVAQSISRVTGAVVFSTDDFWYQEGTGYQWDPKKLGTAHTWNQTRTADALSSGLSVIIDNTNIKREHAQPYFDLADEFSVPVEVIRCHGEYQNIHNVPDNTVQRMRLQMEDLEV